MEIDQWETLLKQVFKRYITEDLQSILDSELDFVFLGHTEKYQFLNELKFRYVEPAENSKYFTSEGIDSSYADLIDLINYHYGRGLIEDTANELKETDGKNNKLNFLMRKRADHIQNGYPIETPNLESDFFHDYLKTEIEYWQNYIEPEPYKGEKLIWKGTPSQFGFIFSELAKQGYIDHPKTFSEWSYAKYARICLQVFDINTTQGNLEKELNRAIGKNTLSDTKQLKFNIPNIQEIS
jgi:hypothetical protein